MIRITEAIEIPAAPDVIWALLHDPYSVARCIPGTDLKQEVAPGVYEATMSVKFGPTVAQFLGEAKLEYDEGARRLTVSGRGFDKRGSSPATGSGVITLAGDKTAILTIDGSVEVSGPLEAFVETGGVFVARAVLAQFAENIGRYVESRGARPAEASQVQAPAASPPVVPLSTGKLLRAILADRWRAFINLVLRRRK